ncbi:tetraspanin-10-like [Synchiropus picturatus]
MDKFRRFWQNRSRPDVSQSESSPLIPKAADDPEDPQQRKTYGPIRFYSRPPPRYPWTHIFLKYFLFLCNWLFAVLGLGVFSLGIWGLVSKDSFAQERIGSIGTDPMLVLVTLGLLMTLLCLTGCVGAVRENCCLLRVFSMLVLTLISAQVVAAILSYTMQDQIGGLLRSGMLAAIEGYQDDLDLRFITDEIQTNLQCCGADDYRDWEINIYYNCSSPGVLACGVPPTCCIDPMENSTMWNSQCGLGALSLDEFTAQSVVYLGGCVGGLSRFIVQNQGTITTVVVVLLAVQILALLATTRLIENIQWHRGGM